MAAKDSFHSGTEGGKPLSEERLTVGRYLHEERERKKISLETVARETRITLANLEALERDDFKSISAPFFVRGFLRTYASHLGLDPQEVIGRYEHQLDLPGIFPETTEPPPARQEKPLFKYILLLLLIVAGVGIGFYLFQKPPVLTPPSPSVTPPPAPTADIQPLSPPPPPSKPVAQPQPPPIPPPPEKASPEPKPLPAKEEKEPAKPPAATPVQKDEEKRKEQRNTLKVVATEKTWMRIIPDDQPTIDVLLQPKETASWSTRGQFNITVGNAGGVEIFFNGVSQGRLGKSGEVVRLILPRAVKPPEPVPVKGDNPSEPVTPKEANPAMGAVPKAPAPSADLPANQPKPVEGKDEKP
jgi:cytoskeleton protein RodZ